MGAVTKHLHIVAGGARREWCDTCNVSEAVWDIHAVSECASELSVVRLGTYRDCEASRHGNG